MTAESDGRCLEAEFDAFVLAGGAGTRLWPLSRMQLPKQFLPLEEDTITLLQATIGRLHPVVPKDNLRVVTGEEHAGGEAYQILKYHLKLLEPEPRSTAPAVALSALWLIHHKSSNAKMMVLPADHLVKDDVAFRQQISRLASIESANKILALGVKPARPEETFGYFLRGDRCSEAEKLSEECYLIAQVFRVQDRAEADASLRDDACYWNTGIYFGAAGVFLEEICTQQPQIGAVVEAIRIDLKSGVKFSEAIKRHYPQMPTLSFDQMVLARSQNSRMICCEMDWFDVGSWDVVFDTVSKREGNNVLHGNVLEKDCHDSLLYSSSRLLSAVGVRDLCVVETRDAVLVVPRGHTGRVREIVAELRAQDAQEHLLHLTVKRPWGSYTVLEDNPGFKIKRIMVYPGARLSLQRHKHRSEHWVVVSGVAEVTNGDQVLNVSENESTYIPAGEKHRLINHGDEPLQIIEVQVGSYLGEDDIERFEDSYGRAL